MSELVRPMEAGDLERALDLWEALMQNGAEADPRYRLAEGAREAMRPWAETTWLPQRPVPHGWVAEREGQVVAFLTGELRRPAPVLQAYATGHIGNLWVEPAWRRRGIGRALVEAFAGEATRHGKAELSVGTLVRDERAVAFWRSLGFEDLLVTLVRHPPPGSG